MPYLLKKSSNVFDTFFPPLSVLKIFTTCSDCLSIKVIHSSNLASISLLALSMYTQILHEKLSMKVKKYHAPPMDMVFIGSHTPECTSFKIFMVRIPPSVGNSRLICLSLTHPSHGNECMSLCAALKSILLTMP